MIPHRCCRSTSSPRSTARWCAEVIRDHTFHRQGERESFPCHGSLYLSLLDEPLVPLTLWKDLSESQVQLQKVGPQRYEGTDGAGATAVWDFVLRSPSLHVLMAYFTYVSPRSNARIDARIVLIVHSSYVRDSNKEPWVQHDVEAYVKIDSKGWKTLARTIRPLIERILEEQVREAGYFISLMSRLVITYPNWACEVVGGQPSIDAATKQQFHELVVADAEARCIEGATGCCADQSRGCGSAATLKIRVEVIVRKRRGTDWQAVAFRGTDCQSVLQHKADPKPGRAYTSASS